MFLFRQYLHLKYADIKILFELYYPLVQVDSIFNIAQNATQKMQSV